MTQAVMFTDGGARPTNPGFAGFAAVITIAGQMHTISRYLGPNYSNNYAEFAGLVVGLKYAVHLGVTQIECYCDSKMVVEGVLGNWHCKTVNLRPFCHEARQLLDRNFQNWTLQRVSRNDNTIADAACTAAINWGRHSNPWLPREYMESRRKFGKVIDPFKRTRSFVRENPGDL